MKKINLLICIAIYCLFAQVKFCYSFSEKNQGVDTIQVKQFIELADSLRNSVPDSAIAYYKKVINVLSPAKKNFSINRILSDSYVGLAYVYTESGDQHTALKYDSIAFTIANANKDLLMQSKSFNIKGLANLRLGNFKDASNYYNKALHLAGEANAPETQAKISANIAVLEIYMGNTQNAIDRFTESLDFALKSNNIILITGLYNNLGLINSKTGNITDAISYFEKANDLNIKYNNLDGIKNISQSLGGVYFKTGNYILAIENFQKSLEIALQMNDQMNSAISYHNLAEAYYAIGDYNLAIEYYYKSIKLNELTENKINLISTFISVGGVYFQQKEFNKAKQFFKKALDLSNEIEYMQGIGQGYSNLASVLCAEEKNDSALIFYNKALKVYQNIDHKSFIASTYSNLSGIYLDNNDFNQAEDFLIKALKIKRELSENDGISQVLFSLSDLYLVKASLSSGNRKSQFLKKAETAGNEAYNIANKINSLQAKLNASHILERTYFELNDIEKAKQFSNLYESLNDSLFSKEKAQAVSFANARWNVEKKQKEIENLEIAKKTQEKIIQQKEAEARQQKIIIWFGTISFVLLLVLVVVGYLYLQKRRAAIYQKQLTDVTMLKMKNIRNILSPHFIFNVLNNIKASISNNPEALKLFDNLNIMIRKSLVNTEKIAIPLKDEIDIVKSFITLQMQRMDNNLKVTWNQDENIDEECLVPGMILQIPVENAIKHGLWPKAKDRELAINIDADPDCLTLIVTDNGVGFKQNPSGTKGTGTGLKVLTNTIHILNQNNEKKISINLTNLVEENPTGTKVDIKIPLTYNYNNLHKFTN